jgi:hypothetical protein
MANPASALLIGRGFCGAGRSRAPAAVVAAFVATDVVFGTVPRVGGGCLVSGTGSAAAGQSFDVGSEHQHFDRVVTDDDALTQTQLGATTLVTRRAVPVAKPSPMLLCGVWGRPVRVSRARRGQPRDPA